MTCPIVALLKWWTRDLRADAPELFDGELAERVICELIAALDEGDGRVAVAA